LHLVSQEKQILIEPVFSQAVQESTCQGIGIVANAIQDCFVLMALKPVS